MISPIGFKPISFKSVQSANKPSEPTQMSRVKQQEKLRRRIAAIDEKIFRLEVQCANAEKNDNNFDKQKAMKEIGRLINHKSMLQAQLFDNLEDIFKNLYY